MGLKGSAEGSHIQMVGAFWNDDSHGCGVQVLQDATRVPGVQQPVAEDRIGDGTDVPTTPAAGHVFSETLFRLGHAISEVCLPVAIITQQIEALN